VADPVAMISRTNIGWLTPHRHNSSPTAA